MGAIGNFLSRQFSAIGQVRGNARVMAMYEPMFSIPLGLIGAYASLYAKALGVTPLQIGLLGSLGSAVSIVCSLLGGYMTDRFGRRRTLLAFDFIGWVLPIIIWMSASTFWHFLVATLLNACSNMGRAAHSCLLVEDTPPEKRRPIFALLQILGILAGFFVPLAGVAVARFGLVPAVRVLYFLFLLSGTTMILLRYAGLRESQIGLAKMKEAETISVADSVRDYIKAIGVLSRNRVALGFLAVEILLAIKDTSVGTFDAIYINTVLKVPTAWIAAFPTINAIVQLMVLWLTMNAAVKLSEKRCLQLGFIFLSIGLVIYILAKPGFYACIAANSVLAASASALMRPALSASWSNAIPNEDRAKLTSVYYLLLSLARTPAGWIAGTLYSKAPIAPFVLGLTLVGLAGSVYMYMTRPGGSIARKTTIRPGMTSGQ